MANSIHDSLTDTHCQKPSPPSFQEKNRTSSRLNLQNVGLVEGPADGAGYMSSLDETNWLDSAGAPMQDPRTSQQHNRDEPNDMDVDGGRGNPLAGSSDATRIGDEVRVGMSSETRPGKDSHLAEPTRGGKEKVEEVETRRIESSTYIEHDAGGREQAPAEQNVQGDPPRPPQVGAASIPQPTAHDTQLDDGQSLANQEAESLSGCAMPHEGGPSITQSEAVAALEQAEQGVVAGSDFSDDGYETDGASATSQSLATSAREFIHHHGRRYHSYKADVNPYLFPNDDREQDREDLKHAMFLKLFNKTLHFSPVPEDANVLDLGTGTGIWCVDFADLHPLSTVLGIDLSPIQTVWVPPNLKFMVDDAEAEWLHPRNSFDLIHTRHTIQAFRNWQQIFARAFEHLKPGAWMECQELDHVPQCSDGTMKDDNPMLAYWLNVTAGLKQLGIDFRQAPALADMMRAAGFVDVTERVFFTPIGPWPKNRALKEVGLYWRATIMEGVEAIALGPMIRGLGWRKEEVEVFIAGVRKAYLETTKEVHAWMPFYVVYGQKPYNA
ncbi:S-adenosyl-L-methionine-dependent methyltransferase [Venturia nashicola]|uniref:S-adenosyl-L-methionine-dependent methyltransferase n=1 Tax=Venturia nashicola TaxID=86259 RepID=A0A4Z1PLX5_9PEZI|nr:S-adenosyl-L-methionine-dependent methyltransferase [Venturia nashicola]